MLHDALTDAQPSDRPGERGSGTRRRRRRAAVTRRARLDAELVRRGLARSREQAQELVAAGQVRVPGRTTVKPATQVTPAEPIVVEEPRRRGATSPAAGTSSRARWTPSSRTGSRSPAGGRWTPARRPAASPTCCCAGVPPVRLRRRGLRAARLVAADRRAGHRPGPHERPGPRAGSGRRPGRPGRGGPVLHLAAAGAARPGRGARATGRRPGADGQAAVRGRPGARSAPAASCASRGCAPRRCAASPRRPATLGLGVAGVTASPLPGPAGNVEYFLWLRRDAEPLDGAAVERGRRGGPAVTGPHGPASSGTPGGTRRWRRCAGQRSASRRPGSACGSSPTRPPTSASRECQAVDPSDGQAADGCELVVVLGGDGTLLRAAEFARDTEHTAARRQPGPRRLPRGGRAGRARRHRRPGRGPRATPSRSG